MLVVLKFIAVFAAALFAGAALYISVAEHPDVAGHEVCGRAVGSELSTRHLDAGTVGIAQPRRNRPVCVPGAAILNLDRGRP